MFQLLNNYSSELFLGFKNTIMVSVLALVFSLVIGSLVGIMQTSHHKGLRMLGDIYVEFFRNIPLLIIVMFFYVVVPLYALAHKASYEGKIAAEAISGKAAAVDYKVMPSVAFTDPEIASYGLTEKEAKDQGLDVKATKFPLAGNGRALSLNQKEGFVRLVATKDDKVIVGAQMVGVGASDVMAEAGLAIEAGMNAEDIALTIHGHPSLGESLMDTAEGVLGMPIHM
ncbi:ABC transporter permease subunit [Aerococcus urinae]